MTRPRILVTGGTGQVGSGLAKAAAHFDFDVVMPGRGDLDLADMASIRSAARSEPWDVILSCGAYTAVDKAESEADLAHAVNAIAPQILAEEAARLDIPILHVSTDYVFNGEKQTPYDEADPVAPLGVYGTTKEAGERGVRDTAPRHIILRTAWVISPWGNNFVKTMLRLGADRPVLNVVADQHGCPTAAGDIASSLLAIAARMIEDRDAPTGTYHFVNAGETTWHGLAEHALRRAAEHGRPLSKVNAIPTSEYPTPAKRPANSRLAVDKIARDYGIRPRPWPAMVDEIVDELLKK